MSTYFVSRHPGAVQWAHDHNLHVDHWVTHLDTGVVQPGDVVIGTLPMHAAAAVCAKGARFIALELTLSAAQRGRELAPGEMEAVVCRLTEYRVMPVRGETA